MMKGRIKNIYKKILKYPVTIWLIASALVLSASYFAFAAYNGTAEVKRVVSTQASSSTVFSSNYMEIFSSTNPAVKNLRTTNEGNFICTITVCNYDQLFPMDPARALIDYTFTAELVRFDSVTGTYVPVTAVQMNDSVAKVFYVKKTMDESIPIDTDPEHSINAGGSFSYTYENESLTGGTSCKDTFDICFDAAEVLKYMPELFIRVTATPSAESIQLNGSGLSTLSAIVSISQGRSVETGWHGSLQEATDRDYDGYNLIIEGSGAGTIDIEWDNERFAMNPAFVSLYGGNGGILDGEETVPGRTGWMKRTLTVDSMRSNRYVVQFYRKDGGQYVYTGNNFAGNYIRCTNYVPTATGN